MNPSKPNDIQFRDPAELRLHPLLKELPEPIRNAAWNSFKDALILAGPDGIPPILIAGDVIMDGARRWHAAKELRWPKIRCESRPLTDAALLMVDELWKLEGGPGSDPGRKDVK